MKLPKKLIFILILLLSTFVFSKSVLAAWYVQPPETWGQKVFDTTDPTGVFKERYTLSILTDIMNSTIAAVGGAEIAMQTPEGTKYVHQPGAIDLIANLTGTLYTVQPASSVEYLAYVGENLGLVKPAYAQGLGFSAFSPVLELWKFFRNVAYLGFVVVFVIVGFMIMFRKKIDPRTVVTLQDSLPRIVVTLLLVTFSYAIVGLIVDIGDFGVRLVGNLLAQGGQGFIAFGTPAESQSYLNQLFQSDVFSLVNPLRDIGDLASKLGETGTVPFQVPVLSWLTITAVFWLAGFFIMFKIFFAIIGPYVAIILSAIFAPIQLMFAALPGGGNTVSGWLRKLIANVAVFPVTFTLLAIAAVLSSGPTLAGKCGITPPGIFGVAPWCPRSTEIGLLWNPPLIGTAWGGLVGKLAGFGILFTIPKVVEIVQGALEIKPQPWEGGAGIELKGALGRIPFISGLARG